MKCKPTLFVLTGLLLVSATAFSQDKRFYIFLCFGQSNIEGNAKFETQDTTVDNRFMVLEAIDCQNSGREKGMWYTAVPPLCRCRTGLPPADYFGRTLVANLPKNTRVGVINVSIGGCKIELFDKDHYEAYVSTAPSWMLNMIKESDGNPMRGWLKWQSLPKKKVSLKEYFCIRGNRIPVIPHGRKK